MLAITRFQILSMLILIVCTSHQVTGQAKIKLKKVREVTVTYPDSTVRANILTKECKVKPHDNFNYYWFYSDRINHNQGGYSGSLLNGDYKVFDLSRRLLTQGKFKNGIKTGQWKQWNTKTGNYYTEYWKKGKRNGTAILYAENGKKISQVNYKNGLKHGKSFYIKNDSTYTVFYKNDKLITTKETSKKRICFFKKKTKIESVNTEDRDKISLWKRLISKFKKPKTNEKKEKEEIKTEKSGFWKKFKNKIKRQKTDEVKK